MIVWRDVSSWSRGDVDRTPKTWQADVLGTRLIVTRHIDYPGKWCSESHGDVRMTIRPESSATSPDEAKKGAINRLRALCIATATELVNA